MGIQVVFDVDKGVVLLVILPIGVMGILLQGVN